VSAQASERVLVVWWDAAQIGRLVQDRHGDLSFAYDPAWLAREDARPVSQSLPLQAEPFDRRACRPFFGGLLPEASQRTGVADVLACHLPTSSRCSTAWTVMSQGR
jgi:serine/threonine-protein kinase HipA